jgi:hypothetical protein
LGRLVLGQVGVVAARAPLALIEPITVAVHFQDMDVMSEAVEQRAGQTLGLDAFMMPLFWTGWCVGLLL